MAGMTNTDSVRDTYYRGRVSCVLALFTGTERDAVLDAARLSASPGVIHIFDVGECNAHRTEIDDPSQLSLAGSGQRRNFHTLRTSSATKARVRHAALATENY
jgi:hypothetical protein